ncbi:MAG: LamG-like jellyroll fold domain-containing protein, partial [Phycisphaerae bacterium]
MSNSRRTLLCCIVLAVSPTIASAQSASSHALRFFGTGTNQQDRVRIRVDDNAPGPDTSEPIDVGSGSFTIELWLRGNLSDNNTIRGLGDREYFDFRWIDGNIIVDRDIWGASSRDWGISLAGGFVQFGTGRADANPLDLEHTIEGNTNVLDGAWHHVAVARDVGTGVKRIFVDGLLDYASPPNRSRDDISYPNSGDSSPQTPWGPFIVLAAEKHDAGSTYPSFNGYLDELRIWNIARSSTDLGATFDLVLASTSPGLVGYYRFEEGVGTSLGDSSSAVSPSGELLAGIVGNGEWVSHATDPTNVAPIRCLPPLCTAPGDVDSDGDVDLADLSQLLTAFGTCA